MAGRTSIVAQVKAELRESGLSTEGTPAELEVRLAEHGHGWTTPAEPNKTAAAALPIQSGGSKKKFPPPTTIKGAIIRIGSWSTEGRSVHELKLQYGQR